MEKFKVDNVTHIASATEMFFVILFELPALENSPLKFKKAVTSKYFFPVLYPIFHDSWLYIFYLLLIYLPSQNKCASGCSTAVN